MYLHLQKILDRANRWRGTENRRGVPGDAGQWEVTEGPREALGCGNASVGMYVPQSSWSVRFSVSVTAPETCEEIRHGP